MNHEKGQSLLEVIIAMTVGILVVTALVFAVIFSLRNAQFAKNSAQATKLAQEGIERVRTLRDRDGSVVFSTASTTTTKFSDLWAIQMSESCAGGICYFRLGGGLTQSVATSFEDLGNKLQRQVQITEDANWATQKKVTVIVQWTDFAGEHQSQLTTILRKL